MKKLRVWMKRVVVICVALAVLLVTALLIYFPGRQFIIAFTLGTGLGVNGLQQRVDVLEEKAIHDEAFTDDEKAFLKDLYTCLAKGGRLVVVYRQTGGMMERYLSMSGEDLYTDPRVFKGSRPAQDEVERLTEVLMADHRGDGMKPSYTSPRFDMGDPTFPDAVAGLYYGTLTVRPERTAEGNITLHWLAEVPWVWPDYESIYAEYGRYHARSFPLPNARSLLQGPRYCLYLDDGLGAHLENLGLAKSFLVYSQWDEVIEVPEPSSD